MLEEMTFDRLKLRYENLIKFNNTIMKSINAMKGHIEKAGRGLDEFNIGSFNIGKSYDKCSFIILNENKQFTKQELINACRSIEQVIEHINDVHDDIILIYRENVPVNYCPKCEHKVMVTYKMDIHFKSCARCSNMENIRMINIED